MSLRLLPAFTMDNDDDDDGNFTKWMSSYWGHGAEAGRSRDGKRSFRRASKGHVERRASLPTVSQLDAMKLSRIPTATVSGREDKQEVRGHQRARRSSSDDNSQPKSAMIEKRITTIPELTEALERRLCVHDQRKNRRDYVCQSGGVQEQHCSCRQHKEVGRQLEACRPRSSSSSEVTALTSASSSSSSWCQMRRRSADGPISTEKEQHALRRQFSLRRRR